MSAPPPSSVPAPAPPGPAAAGASAPGVAAAKAGGSAAKAVAATAGLSGATKKKKSTTKAASTDGSGTAGNATGNAAAPKKKAAPRKRKPPKSSVDTQAIINDAKLASADLARQRELAAARRNDPLWYRVEDLPMDPSVMASKRGILPEQQQIVEAALWSQGLTRADVTPQAYACLLEQARRFAQELLTDAQDYAVNNTARSSDLVKEDLQLAYEMRHDHPQAISSQLPKLNIVAQKVNLAPLPPIPPQCFDGILLPPQEQQLTARTFDVVTSAQVAQKMVQAVPIATLARNNRASGATASGSQSVASSQQSHNLSYGASRGRQIPVKLKESSNNNAGGGSGGAGRGATTSMDIDTPK